MPVIDVDSHWTFPWEFSLDRGPLKRFASQMPSEAGMLTHLLLGDLMQSLPAAESPVGEQLFPPLERPDGSVSEIPLHWEVTRQESNADDRIAWMDRVGIDYAIVNSAGFASAFGLIDDLGDRQAYCRAANDVLAGEIGRHRDRLGPVTYADLSDLDWAISEITRMRMLGSRAFSIRAEPVNGLSLGHPHFDRLWSAITDLGMLVSVHVGLAPAIFGDWGRLGLDVLDPKQRGAFTRMANAHRYQAAELLLSALLFGGVFERHPKLTVLIAELYAFWLPNFVRRMDGLTHPFTEGALGRWDGPLGGDYLRRQVRVSPLPGLGDFNVLEVLQELPEMIVFSSDYPHTEGNADPIGLYGDGLAKLDPDLRAAFLGASIGESFARMGAPLSAAV